MTGEDTTVPLLQLDDLVTHFPIRGGPLQRRIGIVRAVDGVDLTVYPGETLGIVGESGCGKTTLARTAVKLQQPTAGEIIFAGRNITALNTRQMREVRRDMQVVFQDPYASLDPRMKVRDILSEPLRAHGLRDGSSREHIGELLETVGLSEEHATMHPRQFSGGQRQRIGIARALAVKPKLIVLDEPVSALDVSIRAQIVNLLRTLQQKFGLTYIFVAHDLSIVRHVCDRVAVMYLGRIIETGTKSEIYTRPSHPYTRALLSAVPVDDPDDRGTKRRIILDGDVPSPLNPPTGCPFRTRCWKAQSICAEEPPDLEDRGQGHPVACHFPEAAAPAVSADTP